MGYNTKFEGELRFNRELLSSEIKIISSFFGEECPKCNGYVDLCFTDDYQGLKWDGSEKTYDLEHSINWMLNEITSKIPDLDLTGELKAQGKDSDDRWFLRMNDGVALKVEAKVENLEIEWHDASVETPDTPNFGGSERLLVLRDAGPGSRQSFSITSYKPDGWGRNSGHEKWLYQESRGFRVLKWAYLPEV